MTLRRRLALGSAAAVAAAIVFASVVIYFVVRGELRSDVDEQLQRTATESSVAGITVPAERPGVESLPSPRPLPEGIELALPPPPLGSDPGLGQLISAEGEVVIPTEGQPTLPVADPARQVAAGERESYIADEELGGVHLRVLTVPAFRDHAFMVARSLEGVDRTLSDLALVLVLVSAGGIGLGALFGWLVSRTTLSPVVRLTDAAEHVSRTRDLGRRIEPGSDDELGRLAASFNEMLAELERAVSAQRQLVADASHELRTPLTSLRTNIEVLARPNGLPAPERRRLIDDVVTQLAELGTLVGNLVDLARDEEPTFADEPVRLDLLAAAAVRRAARRARDLRFAERLDPCIIEGSPERLERVLDNLLDNAVKWSPAGGEIEVVVTRAGELTVRDHGPGLEGADASRVFDRFWRAPAARGTPGSGLGLAIVLQVVEAHGGVIRAEPAPGGGTLMRVLLPASPMLLANS